MVGYGGGAALNVVAAGSSSDGYWTIGAWAKTDGVAAEVYLWAASGVAGLRIDESSMTVDL